MEVLNSLDYGEAACKRLIEVSMGLVRAKAGTLAGQRLEPHRPTLGSCFLYKWIRVLWLLQLISSDYLASNNLGFEDH